VIALLLAAALPAQAQQLDPAKPIRLIVGLAAGGGTDVTARLVAQKMSESMKMTVLVENKAGGIFIPALREVTNAAPDGHTLYFISTSSLITQPLHPDYPLDIMKLAPVTEVATGPLILAARNSLGVKTIKELIDLTNAKPGAIKFGAGGGTGSSLYLATELLKARTGIKITIVPYRGAGPALNDMLGDHIDAMFDAMPVMSVQAKEGKVTPLAVTGTKRSFALPNVPTIMESGLDYQIAGWYGILAPPGTPAPIVQKLRDEVAKAVAPKDVVDTLASQGMEPRATQPAEWAKYMASEMAFYTKIIKDANIKP
jgi:tripartite-type tricarboxylate transporter receptor subunit TctC